MKKNFVKPEIKGIRLRENILAGSGGGRPVVIHNEDGSTTSGLFFGQKCNAVSFPNGVEHIYKLC